MKLVSKEEYEKMSPVKKDVYLRRLEKYFGWRWYTRTSPVFVYDPNEPEKTKTWTMYDEHSGTTFQANLDKIQDAANILREYGNMDVHDCIERIWHELGF